MASVRASYHPFLFLLMSCCAMAEIGLTAFLINSNNEERSWPSPRYHSLLILLLFNSIWTLFFSVAYLLWIMNTGVQLVASIASSAFWQIITTALWGAAAGLLHNTRTRGNCAGLPILHRCRQNLTMEALGWSEFGLCAVTLIATGMWILATMRLRASEDLKDARRAVSA